MPHTRPHAPYRQAGGASVTVTADTKRVIDQWGEMPPAIALDDYAGAPVEQRSADFEGTFSGNGTAARGLSLFLLDLYALANRTGIGEFEHGFFRLLSQHLPFDAGWTGVTTHTANGPVMHNSFVYGLPGEFFTDWQRVRDCDPLALGSMNRYGRALEVSIVAPGIDPRFRNWAIKYGLAQLMVSPRARQTVLRGGCANAGGCDSALKRGADDQPLVSIDARARRRRLDAGTGDLRWLRCSAPGG
jgi:hypothetical protein